jgi:hypothetical protein
MKNNKKKNKKNKFFKLQNVFLLFSLDSSYFQTS